jgi:hypothetical protein
VRYCTTCTRSGLSLAFSFANGVQQSPSRHLSPPTATLWGPGTIVPIATRWWATAQRRSTVLRSTPIF